MPSLRIGSESQTMMDWLSNGLYPVCGFIAGAAVGMTGVGGGALMTPLLIILFGMQPESAVGMDLLYASATKAAGTAAHNVMNSVDWYIVARLSLGSLPASILTLMLLWNIRASSEAGATLIRSVLGVVLCATALVVLFRKAFSSRRGLRFVHAVRTPILTIATGFALGVLVSIASVGAGALGVIALTALYPRLPLARVVGSDIAHAVLLTLVAGTGHALFIGVNWPLLISLLAGSIPGVLLGSYFVHRVSDGVVRRILGTILALAGIRLVLAL
jgi:hypothetical protein